MDTNHDKMEKYVSIEKKRNEEKVQKEENIMRTKKA